MADAGETGDRKLKVFISYSRKDEDFAQELLGGLELAGFEPYLDKRDIAAGEDWEARLGRLIESADTVVFVVSPDAVASKRCALEVERTVVLKKRLLPIVWRRVDAAQVPPRLKQLNYIYFDRPLSFTSTLKALATALRTDLAWIREHTRIGEAALRWDGRARNEALLFRGDELAAAKAWLAAQPQYAPEPTLLHHEFIKTGEDAEAARTSTERQRLDEMAAAQAEREIALEREKAAQGDREKALERERTALRRGRRALIAAIGLFAFIIVGAIGWYKHETYQRNRSWWRLVMGPESLSNRRERALRKGDEFIECARGCPVMVVVPTGTFMMGSPENEKDRNKDEGPLHTVTIARQFAVSKFEVTFNEWVHCSATGACPTVSGSEGLALTMLPGFSEDESGRRPVTSVTWDDAKAYVAWLSRLSGKDYRLLSEAEFEYAARAGSTTRYPWGGEMARTTQTVTAARANGMASKMVSKQRLSAHSNRTRLGSMICTATSRSGWRTAIMKIMKMLRTTAAYGVRTASIEIATSSVAVRGTSPPSACAQRIASAQTTRFGRTTLGSVSRGRLPPDPFPRCTRTVTISALVFRRISRASGSTCATHRS